MWLLNRRLLESNPDGGAGGGYVQPDPLPVDDGPGGAGADEGTDDGDAGGGEPDSGATALAAAETQAKERGWVPKAEWRGNPNNWTDAAEFNRRAETFVPFLRKQTQELKGELSARDREIAALRAQNTEMLGQMKGITEFNEQMAVERTARRKVEIGAELRAAREAGDDVRVAELQNELGDVIKPPPAKVTPPPAAPVPPADGGVQPWVKAYIDTNAEFFKNPYNIALFNADVMQRRSAGDARVGEVDGVAFLNESREKVLGMLNPGRRPPPKTEGPRSTGNGGGTSSDASYATLPADARAQCDKEAARYVGEGKLFKTKAAWQKHYVAEYFGPSVVAMARTLEG